MHCAQKIKKAARVGNEKLIKRSWHNAGTEQQWQRGDMVKWTDFGGGDEQLPFIIYLMSDASGTS